MSISTDDLLHDKEFFHNNGFRPGCVKNFDGMTMDQDYLDQLEIINLLGNLKFDSTVMDQYNTIYDGHKTYEECMEMSGDRNLMILLEMISISTLFSDPDNEFDKGFINLLKMIVSLYKCNPYVRDRVGWMFLSIVKRVNKDGYFPVELLMRFDPRFWHRPGEVYSGEIDMPKTFVYAGRSKMEFGPTDDIWNYPIY